MTLGLLKACSKGLVLKVMFIQFSAGDKKKTKQKGGDGEDGVRTSECPPETALTLERLPKN